MRINISPRAVAYVRDRVQGLMACQVEIYDSAGMAFDETTGMSSVVVREPWYSGKARIWETNSGATQIVGESPVAMMQTNISIPFDAGPPKKDQIVVVTDAPQDPDLVGRAFRVLSNDGTGQIGAVRRMAVSAYDDSFIWQRQ